jgi:hypothetical protein
MEGRRNEGYPKVGLGRKGFAVPAAKKNNLRAAMLVAN